MKTQKIYLMKTELSIMMLTMVLILGSCGGNQENSVNESGQQDTSQNKVEPPAMDILTATVTGDLQTIQQHIEAGSELNEKEPNLGSTALITAAVFGKTEIAKALIEGGADVNLKNNEGATALHSAAFLCRLEIVEMLIAYGADKNLRNNYGSTAGESVSAPFKDVKFIYDQFSKDLGPMGFKLDYAYVEETRPKIAEMLR